MITFIKKIFFYISVILLISSNSNSAENNAEAFVLKLTDEAKIIFNDKSLSKDSRLKKLNDLSSKYLDLDALAGYNLGDTVYWSTKGTEITNFRSQNIKSSENLEKNSLDLYSAYKSLYLQRRENLVKNIKRSESQYGASDDEWKKIK